MLGLCEACGQFKPLDKCHIKTRGAGAGNEPWEYIMMCREHHQEQHKIGWARFADKYPAIKKSLSDRGWVLENVIGIIKLVRVGKDHE